jgi:hypothetical protein
MDWGACQMSTPKTENPVWGTGLSKDNTKQTNISGLDCTSKSFANQAAHFALKGFALTRSGDGYTVCKPEHGLSKHCPTWADVLHFAKLVGVQS